MAHCIDSARCNGCGVCLKSCPVGAVSGEKKKLHAIDGRLCMECSVCGIVCPTEAVLDSEGRYVPKLARGARPRPVTELWACTGCRVCVDRCPVSALFMELAPPSLSAPPPAGLVARVNLKQCVGCSICAGDCPYGAIVMRPLTEAKKALEAVAPGPARAHSQTR